MRKILSIIGFLLLISCSSGDVLPQEKSKSQKQQDTPALNLRPIEQLSPDVQTPNPSQKTKGQLVGEAFRKKHGLTPDSKGWVHVDLEKDSAFMRDVHRAMDSISRSKHE
ncbi:MAG: hypothetical protein AUK31_08290 [Fibrobacteres bacterium CG2_30_45_31]|nr:MAG: hypothetical protein AUK31_08290 [Fibrobacteres bacterium CG2_30_45_31]